jgi:dTDP-4-amino-4,6-dideoxygalactose transaminase
MINVTKSYLPDLKKYQNYVERIYAAGWLTNNAHLVQELTRRLEQYLQVKNLILVSNATLGLQLAYKALRLKGEVITTPFSFVATTSSLVWEGLKPKFIDIHPQTFCLDEALIEAAISKHTSAILPVHVYGNVCAVEHIQKIAAAYDLKVIYDAAHAFGVNYLDKSVLTWGDISVLSFHATKLFHTVEGGALVINDDEVYQRVKEKLNFGFDRNGSGEAVRIGINAKMSEFHAAMGLCVLDEIEHILLARKKLDQLYRQNLSSRVKFLQIKKNANPNYAYFPIVFESEAQLLKAVQSLNSAQIYPRRYFCPALNTLPYLDYEAMPISESISTRVLCLPIFPDLAPEAVLNICTLVNKELES